MSARLTDDQLRDLAANARANGGNVDKWLDRDRSLALIEEVLAQRGAIGQIREHLAACVQHIGEYPSDLRKVRAGQQLALDRIEWALIELRKLVGE